MALSTLANFRAENFLDKELINTAMERFTKEVLKEVNQKGTEPTNLPMEMHMLVNSKQIHFTGKELSLIISEVNMKENLLKVYIMDREPSHFQMEDKIVGHGKMAC